MTGAARRGSRTTTWTGGNTKKFFNHFASKKHYTP